MAPAPATASPNETRTSRDEELLADPWRGWNPFDPASDPNRMYEHLADLRRLDPVNETPVGIWRLTRYADVVRLLKDVPSGVRTTDGRSYAPHLDDPEVAARGNFMLTQDPPTHTRLRKLVSRAFTPRAIERTADLGLRWAPVGEALHRHVETHLPLADRRIHLHIADTRTRRRTHQVDVTAQAASCHPTGDLPG